MNAPDLRAVVPVGFRVGQCNCLGHYPYPYGTIGPDKIEIFGWVHRRDCNLTLELLQREVEAGAS